MVVAVETEVTLKNVLDSKFEFVERLCNTVGSDSERLFELAELLLKIFKLHGRELDLLKWAISFHVKNTPRAEELFREGNMAVYLMLQYFHAHNRGAKYLNHVVVPLLIQVISNPKVDKITEESAPLLISFLKYFMENLVKTASFCPVIIRETLLFFQQEIERKFSGETKAIACSSFFLRFICPTIISPHLYGLIGDAPRCQIALVLCAKILQTIANHTIDLEPLTWLDSSLLRDFINESVPLMDDFMNILLDQNDIDCSRMPTSPGKQCIMTEECYIRFLVDSIKSLVMSINAEESKDTGIPQKRARTSEFSCIHSKPQDMLMKIISCNAQKDAWKRKSKNEKDQFKLYTSKTEGKDTVLKLVGEVNTSVKTLHDYITNIPDNIDVWKSIFPSLNEIKQINKYNDNLANYYATVSLPFPFRNRDFMCTLYNMYDSTADTSAICAYSLKNEEYVGSKGFIRGEIGLSGILLNPIADEPNKCTMTTILQMNFKGGLSRTIHKESVLAVAAHVNRWISSQTHTNKQ